MGDEPGYFCSCINAMAVSRADYDAQSLELQAVREERDELLVKLGKHLLDKARAAADIMDRKARTDAATSPADIAELPGT